MASITSLLNGMSGLVFRDTINTNITNLNNDKTETSVTTTLSNRVTTTEGDVSTLTTNLSTTDGKVDVLEDKVDSLTSVLGVQRTTPYVQNVVANVPELLTCFESKVLDNGTDLSVNLGTNIITINNTKVYRLEGVVNVGIDTNSWVKITLYKNNVPTPFMAYVNGIGIDKPLSMSYITITPFEAGDELSLYVESEDTQVKIHSMTMSLEATPYTA